MRKLIPLAAVILAACSDIAVYRMPQMAMQASASEMRIGEAVNLDITVSNPGASLMQVVEECQPPYVVEDLSGVVVGPGLRMCALDLKAPRYIMPGAQIQLTAAWYGDSLGIRPADGFNYLPPGKYNLRSRVMIVDRGYVFGPAVAITIKP